MKNITKFLVISLIVVALMSACSPKAQEPANHWEEVKSKGKLLIGTSADYPPFEYIDEEGEFAGFDVEIMKQLGEKLGVEVEIQDMPFDSLIVAVQEGKIDMSVAAFNYTEERDEYVDFSEPYYNAQDGFLGAADFEGEINVPEDAANYVVGVINGSTQDSWVMENLVEAGLLSEENLFKYERYDQAAMDVKSGRIDIMMAEAVVLKSFEEEMGGLKVAYIGQMSSGPVAMILPEGDTELVEAVNGAIAEMFDEGLINEYVLQYMKQKIIEHDSIITPTERGC